MQVILIYTTDPWHSHSSKELIAVATTEQNRDTLIKRYLAKRNHYIYDCPDRETVEQALDEIWRMGQTQCLSEKCDFEIITEELETNVIFT